MPLLGPCHHIPQRRAVRLTRESRYLVLSKLQQWREKAPSQEDFVKQIDEFSSVFNGLIDLLEVNVQGLARVEGAATAERTALQRLTDAFNAELHRMQVIAFSLMYYKSYYYILPNYLHSIIKGVCSII